MEGLVKTEKLHAKTERLFARTEKLHAKTERLLARTGKLLAKTEILRARTEKLHAMTKWLLQAQARLGSGPGSCSGPSSASPCALLHRRRPL